MMFFFKEGEVEPHQKIRKKEKPQVTTSSEILKIFKPSNKNDEANKNKELNKDVNKNNGDFAIAVD